MADFNTVFKRYEKKFVLRGNQYKEFREKIDPYMQEDDYGLSTICNLYYDTGDYALIRNSIEKPVYKEKLRLRSYGVPESDESTVFLEVKKKYDGIVYKRRIPMSLRDAKITMVKREVVGNEGQIASELTYFLKHYKPVNATYVAYDRVALFGKEDQELRMTFDFRIRSRLTEPKLESGDYGELLLPEDAVILEVKVQEAYPFWLIRIFEEMKIYPASISKYGTAYKTKILPALIQARATEVRRQENEAIPKRVFRSRGFAGRIGGMNYV